MAAIPNEFVSSLKHALYYVRKFKEKYFVVKIGGELVSNQSALDNICSDISILHALGINVVVVHGGGPQLDETSKKLGIQTKKINGRRITDGQTLQVATMVLAGQMNTQIAACMKKHKVPCIGMTGLAGDLVEAEKAEPEAITDSSTGKTELVDMGFVAKIKKVRPALIASLCHQGLVPVICSMVSDENGQVLNRNADVFASHLAIALQAEKLLVLSNVPGVLSDKKDEKSLIAQMTTAEAGSFMHSGAADGGMVPKLGSCIDAVQGGVGRAHILSGIVPSGLLLETFTDSGIGTMIVNPHDKKLIEDKEFD